MKLLRRKDLSLDPFKQFARWLEDARRRARQTYPDALCLSTFGRDGFPEGRMVLLKGADSRGLVFYTNLESAKGCELKARPRAALTIYWDRLARQVRVVGEVERVSDEEADIYFSARPRFSQIAAWASRQSAILPNRETLDRRMARLAELYRGRLVPRPPYWHGFRVVPIRFEFWQGQSHRLHDRFLYVPRGRGWRIQRLYP